MEEIKFDKLLCFSVLCVFIFFWDDWDFLSTGSLYFWWIFSFEYRRFEQVYPFVVSKMLQTFFACSTLIHKTRFVLSTFFFCVSGGTQYPPPCVRSSVSNPHWRRVVTWMGGSSGGAGGATSRVALSVGFWRITTTWATIPRPGVFSFGGAAHHAKLLATKMGKPSDGISLRKRGKIEAGNLILKIVKGFSKRYERYIILL